MTRDHIKTLIEQQISLLSVASSEEKNAGDLAILTRALLEITTFRIDRFPFDE